jgi:glycine cleavage system aminomethyltransferase T
MSRMTPEDANRCEVLYEMVGQTFDKYEDEISEKLDPTIALAVVAKLYASIGYNLEIDKKGLLSYMAGVIDDAYYGDNENDDR